MLQIQESTGLTVGPQEWAPRDKGPDNRHEWHGSAQYSEADRMRARKIIMAIARRQPEMLGDPEVAGAWSASRIQPFDGNKATIQRVWPDGSDMSMAELEMDNFGSPDIAPLNHGIRDQFDNRTPKDFHPVPSQDLTDIEPLAEDHDAFIAIKDSDRVQNFGAPLLYSDATVPTP